MHIPVPIARDRGDGCDRNEYWGEDIFQPDKPACSGRNRPVAISSRLSSGSATTWIILAVSLVSFVFIVSMIRGESIPVIFLFALS